MMDKIAVGTNKPISSHKRTSETHSSANRAASRQKEKSEETDSDFQSELAGAAAVVSVSPQVAQLAALPAEANGLSAPTPAHEGMAKALSSLQEEGAKAGLQENRLERSPIAQKTAISMNTASAMAGLKPWSKDWVFEGGMDANPGLRPLFGDAPMSEAQLAAQKISQLRAKGGEAEGASTLGSDESQQNLGALAAALKGTPYESMISPMASPGTDAAGAARAHGVGAGADSAEAASQMGQLGNVGQAGITNEGVSRSLTGAPSPAGAGSLSGSEYLSTLAALQGNAGHGSAGSNLSGDEGGMGGSRHQQQKHQLTGTGDVLASRIGEGQPFQVVEGAKFKKPVVTGLESSGDGIPAAIAHHSGGGVRHDGPAFMMPTNVAGHVTQGAMTRERLSSESLLGITNGIRNLTPSGGGEIHVRLNPDNLGELRLRVTTDGNQVGLKIQASDDHARKILEESLSHLSESLAKHQLTLKTVDLSVAQGSAGAQGDFGGNSAGSGHSSGSHAFNGFDLMGDSGRNGQQGRSGDSWGNSGNYAGSQRSSGTYGLSSANGAASDSARRNVSGRSSVSNGRLDVMA